MWVRGSETSETPNLRLVNTSVQTTEDVVTEAYVLSNFCAHAFELLTDASGSQKGWLMTLLAHGEQLGRSKLAVLCWSEYFVIRMAIAYVRVNRLQFWPRFLSHLNVLVWNRSDCLGPHTHRLPILQLSAEVSWWFTCLKGLSAKQLIIRPPN